MVRPKAIRRTIIGGGLFLGLFLVAMAFKPLVVESFNRSKCRSNLSAIGQCILLYANDHHGTLPPDLGSLAWEEDATAEVFICPSSDTSVPSDLPPNQVVAWVNANSDYVYLGAGMQMPPGGENFSSWQNVVLAYDKDQSHHGKGISVLFGDARVEWMSIESAHRAIALSQANRPATTQPISSSSRP